MTPVMANLCHAVEVVQQVQARLEDAGAVVELDQLAGLSTSELALLVERELR